MKSLNLKSLSFFFAVLMMSSMLFTSCEDDSVDEPNFPETLTEVLADDFELSTMARAIERANLTTQLNNTTTGVTVFAPTNEAFTNFFNDSEDYYALEDIPIDILKKIILYHVIEGNVGSFDLPNGYVTTSAEADVEGAPFLTLRVNPTDNKVNNSADITAFDIDGIGNTIHVINEVNSIPNVLNAAQNDGRLGRLVSELTTAGLSGDLQTDGPFTIFAPDDEAIQWGTSMGIANVDQILLDHVISGNFRSADLTNDLLLTTAGMDEPNEYKLRITETSEGKEIKIVEADNTNVAIATVSVVDIQANNGVLHMIDNVIVLLP